jgi:hypothetical protein
VYKIKVYKNGKLFAEYDVNEYMLMDENGKAFVSTGEPPQQFIIGTFNKGTRQEEQEDSNVVEPPEEKEKKKTPSTKDKQALKFIISKMNKDEH